MLSVLLPFAYGLMSPLTLARFHRTPRMDNEHCQSK